jgi:hypothetical protein
MIMTIDTTADITPLDLRVEVEAARRSGQEVTVYLARREGYAPVWTAVFTDTGRAGQAVNADAEWGEWDEQSETISLDCGTTVDLYGMPVR